MECLIQSFECVNIALSYYINRLDHLAFLDNSGI